MKWEKFNINQSVRLKVTEEGEKIYKNFLGDPKAEIRDAEGWTKLPLWDAMRIFGPSMKLGGGELNPLKGDMEFEVFEREEKEKEE